MFACCHLLAFEVRSSRGLVRKRYRVLMLPAELRAPFGFTAGERGRVGDSKRRTTDRRQVPATA